MIRTIFLRSHPQNRGPLLKGFLGFSRMARRTGNGRTAPFGSRPLGSLLNSKPVGSGKKGLSISRAHALLIFRGRTRKDSGYTFWDDVERQECQWLSTRVSPLVYKAERFVD